MDAQSIENGMRDAGKRSELVKSAAQVLSSLPDDVVIGIACSSPTNFVNTVRKTFRTHGFSFTDRDLRDIHDGIRFLTARKLKQGTVGNTPNQG